MKSINNTECLIDGEIVPYDMCSCNELEVAKEFLKKKFEYIGSTITYFINGEENTSKKLYHYFKYKV